MIWTILGITALILLVVYGSMHRRNAVWGGLTIGIIIGVLWKLIGGTDWYIVVKVATIATLVGFGAELLGMIGDRLNRRRRL